MPFSSVLGASTVIKPGVCTSTNRPTTPYDGQVIYETDTDKTLVWNSTGWVFLSTSRANPGGFDLITSGSFTSVNSVSLPNNTFTSTYVNYLLNINLTANSSDSNPLWWRGRVSGSDNATSNYFYGLRGTRFSDGLTTSGGFGASQTVGMLTRLQNPFTTGAVTATFFGPQLASNTTYITQATGRGNSDPDSALNGGGYFGASTQFDSLSFIANVGTISGTYEVYGYAR